MNVTVEDVMMTRVMMATPSQTVAERVRDVMNRNSIHSMPVVNPDHEPLGIITSSDLLNGHSDNTPISHVMSKTVFSIQRYSGPHIAARMMRNHGIHHVVVTDENRVVGIVSSYDLLRLVEDHRFVMKSAPSTGKSTGKRGQSEG